MAKELKMTVKNLLENTSSRELSEWEAYFKAMEDIQKGKDTDNTLQMKLINAFTKKNEQGQ